MKIILAVFILIHGIIHSIGFLNAWKLKEFKEFTGKTIIPLSDAAAKAIGIMWLVALAVFIIGGAGLFFDQKWWRAVIFAAVVLSQILIVIYWRDAKAGTIANVMIVIGMFLIN
jgi:hypothetical protein